MRKQRTEKWKTGKVVVRVALECILLFAVCSYFPRVFLEWRYQIPQVDRIGNRAELRVLTNGLQQRMDAAVKRNPNIVQMRAELHGNAWELCFFGTSQSNPLQSETVRIDAETYQQLMRALDVLLPPDASMYWIGADRNAVWIGCRAGAWVYSRTGRKPDSVDYFKEGEQVYCHRVSLHWCFCAAYQPNTGMDVLVALARLTPWLAVGGWIGWNGLLGWTEASERKRKEGNDDAEVSRSYFIKEIDFNRGYCIASDLRMRVSLLAGYA